MVKYTKSVNRMSFSGNIPLFLTVVVGMVYTRMIDPTNISQLAVI